MTEERDTIEKDFDYSGMEGDGIPELSDSDFARLALPHIDHTAQFSTIRAILRAQRAIEARQRLHIEALGSELSKARGSIVFQIDGEYLTALQDYSYSSIAHSAVAAVMLAPFVEGVFRTAFSVIGSIVDANPTLRLQNPREGTPELPFVRWDCAYYRTNVGNYRNDVVKGTFELASCIGMDSRWPSASRPRMEALFRYRNKIFHHGLEWPADQCEKFAAEIRRRVADGSWREGWFPTSKPGGTPSMFWLTEMFTNECLEMFEYFLSEIGAYVRNVEDLRQHP